MSPLPYPSKTFTAGQVPTTAQWNELNANDQALAAGTGFASTASLPGANILVPHKFLAYRSAGFTVPAGTQKINFDAEIFDTGNNFDSTTNFRFVAPIAGVYEFAATINISLPASKVAIASLYKNGAEYFRGNIWTTVATQDSGVSVQGMMVLAVNDYVEVYVYNGATGSSSINAGSAPIVTYFTGKLVSK